MGQIYKRGFAANDTTDGPVNPFTNLIRSKIVSILKPVYATVFDLYFLEKNKNVLALIKKLLLYLCYNFAKKSRKELFAEFVGVL